LFVGDCVYPGVIRGKVVESEDVFCIAERDWVDLTTDIRRNAEERDFRFIRDSDGEWGTCLLAENTKIAVLGVEFDAELSKTFFRGVE